ncbi:hypothetical protein [Glycomyces artemisiae]|uniref:Uncharacterized protein n=1 Tax=Glycomyces artemisiae TaxID=1076443 RepID=A0A2T0UCR3_9ACTN|nr:hypothetical protein [Glycomyces artemisiae]PRY55731.1 hypothetical protein B0I28_11244 [Glycomyces artemisiae]
MEKAAHVAGGESAFTYRRGRAIEHARHELGLTPTRIFACLLPLWRVEIQATVTLGRPYDLIDRFLEEAIATAGLDTAAALADFYSLDDILVDRALRFLVRIDHLVEHRERYRLTDLGRRSIQEGERFERKKGDRRVLYFEALTSQPLTREYYDTKSVSIVESHELHRFTRPDKGVRFQPVGPVDGLHANALQALARRPDRDRFNLPGGVEDLVALGADRQVYLPAFVIRAEPRGGGRPHCLVYSQVGAKHDPELSEACTSHAFLAARLEQMESQGVGGLDRERIAEWLDRQGFSSRTPVKRVRGVWRVELPERTFGGKDRPATRKIGQYEVTREMILQLWCGSPHARTRALLDRAAVYLASARSPKPDQAEARLTLFRQQLELDPIDLGRLADLAAEAGHHHLAEQLRELR